MAILGGVKNDPPGTPRTPKKLYTDRGSLVVDTKGPKSAEFFRLLKSIFSGFLAF